jgi:serine/threonine protein phosphatase PrpC
MKVEVARCFINTRQGGNFTENSERNCDGLIDYLNRFYPSNILNWKIISTIIREIEMAKQNYPPTGLSSPQKYLKEKLYSSEFFKKVIETVNKDGVVPQCKTLEALKEHLLQKVLKEHLSQQISPSSNSSIQTKPWQYFWLSITISLIILISIIIFLLDKFSPLPFFSKPFQPILLKIILQLKNFLTKIETIMSNEPITTDTVINSPAHETSMSNTESPQPSSEMPSNPAPPLKPEWLLVGASVIGKAHLDSGIPCQDSYCCEPVNKRWGIVALADGAGSVERSEMGSHFVTKKIVKLLKPQFYLKNNVPIYLNSKEIFDNFAKRWHKLAPAMLQQVKKILEARAKEFGELSKNFACTVIVVIYSPYGLLITHIGDGRAAYRNQHGEWKAMMKPHKGEEANETIFLTSAGMETFIESNVIAEEVTAFALLSDGCEKHSFVCSQLNKSSQQWADPNEPHAGFFEPIYVKLKKMSEENVPNVEIQAKWESFLKQGTSGLLEEPDDKTMIIGVLR